MLLSKKQREFVLNATKRWNFKGGATRSGKTYLDFRWVVPMRIRERIDKGGLVVILGVTKSTIERNVLEPMRKIYGPEFVGRISSDNTVKLFGEKCYALGAEKVSQVSKLRGSSIKYCYGDEVVDWDEEVFTMLKSRLDQPYSCFDGTYNPKDPDHWLKKFIDNGIGVYNQQYTIDDNPWLDAGVVAALKAEYAGTVYYARYILGEWAKAEGLVYPMFSRDRHTFTETPIGDGEYYISIDYGTINPTVFGLWRLEKGKAIMLKEYYHNSREKKKQKTDEEYYEDLVEFAAGYEIEKVIIDPSAASFKETIRRHGGFHLMDANNKVLDGIRFVCTLLGQDKVLIHADCEQTLKEFSAYSWDEESSEDKVIKEYDHSMDQMRYMLMTLRWKYFKRESEPQEHIPVPFKGLNNKRKGGSESVKIV